MNLVEAEVTKVKGQPFEDYGWWWVKVEYVCYSVSSDMQLMFKTKEEAEKVKIGYKFLT
jgi:hypothetical protein